MQFLRALYSITVAASLVFIFGIYIVVRLVCGAKRQDLQMLGRAWAAAVLRCLEIKVNVIGAEKICPGRSYMIVANHASALDIPALMVALSGDVRMVSKKSLKYIPIFGLGARLIGTVFIDRFNRETHSDSFSEIGGAVGEGASVVMFAEGTRTRDGNLREFKKGAFVLAIQHRLPILPVVIKNTFELLPEHRWVVKKGTIDVVILDPVDTTGYRHEDRTRLRDEVRMRFLECLKH